MANLRGTVTQNLFETDIKKRDCRDFIFQLEPDEAPFTTLLAKLRKEKCSDVEFSWFEDGLLGKYTAINFAAGYDDNDTALVVDNADIFMANDIVKNTRTGEIMRITAVNVGTQTITVVRGWGTTAAAAILDNDDLFRLGNAQAEAWTAPDSLITEKQKKSNYIQLFSKTVKFSDTANAISTFGGNRRNLERKKMGLELKKDIESQFLWGEKKLDTTGATPRYQTAGVWSQIYGTAPNLAAGGEMTKAEFDAWLKDVFAYGGSERFLFTSNLVISVINDYGTGTIHSKPEDVKKWGFRFMTYISTFGDVHLVNSRQFVGPLVGYGQCLDPKELCYRYLEGLDLSMKTDIQAKDSHFLEDEYSGQIGIEVRHPLRHGTLSGVTT